MLNFSPASRVKLPGQPFIMSKTKNNNRKLIFWLLVALAIALLPWFVLS